MAERIVAVVGKGGVGKTAISAALLRSLAERRPGARILAIDADSAGGLAEALGIEPAQTLDDIRRFLAGAGGSAIDERNAEARFRIFDAMEEANGLAFLALGRSEGAGCYCAINGCLRRVVSLLADEFDYVVIDGEAGVEQINRRVMERVTDLLLVTDQSRKGRAVLETIRRVADELTLCERCGAVVNRATHPAEEADIAGAPVLAVIPEDARQTRCDALGKSVFEQDEDSAVRMGAREILRSLLHD